MEYLAIQKMERDEKNDQFSVRPVSKELLAVSHWLSGEVAVAKTICPSRP
jgi:hypothetical protein